jgi:hypothetical protein
MLHSSKDERARGAIQEAAADFEVCARRAVECLLNRPTMLSKAFNRRTRFAAEPEIRCFIESGEGDKALVISLGLSKSDLRSLFSDERDEAMGLDAIGEILNIIAGTLFARPGFRSRFGGLRASVPFFTAPSLEKGSTRSIRGVLVVETARLNLELSVGSGFSGGKP